MRPDIQEALSHKAVKGIRSEWYEAGKFYKLGFEYAGKYTPAVEIPESVGGCLAPETTHGFVSFEREVDDIERGRIWSRKAVSFGKDERNEFVRFLTDLKKLEV